MSKAGNRKRGEPIAQALDLQRRAARRGFDWDEADGLWRKLAEEIGELRAARSPGARREELGDLLFMVVNLARHLGVDPAAALRAANAKFARRYGYVLQRGAQLPPLGDPQRLARMEALWQQAKRLEKRRDPD
jgi:uncharacterized protein YabN with tetrapyrrole methylase and pyrophosphatase domain